MARALQQSPRAPQAWDGVLRHQHQQYSGSGELKASILSEICGPVFSECFLSRLDWIEWIETIADHEWMVHGSLAVVGWWDAMSAWMTDCEPLDFA